MPIEVAHCLPGRLRLRLPGLGNAALSGLRRHLGNVPGVHDVRVNAATGSLLVTFDAHRLGPQEIMRMLTPGVQARDEVAVAAERVAHPGAGGLSHREAADRLRQFGPNVLPAPPAPPVWQRFAMRFTDLPTVILLAGTGFAALAGRTAEMWAVGAATGLNALIGAWRSGHGDPALAALRTMAPPAATAIRGGAETVLPAADLVPGDLILLNPGDRAPADLVMLESSDLEVSHSQLQEGDSPDPSQVADGAFIPIGSDVLRGHGRGVVVATGGRTTLGQIAGSLDQHRRLPFPVERRTARLARYLLKYPAAGLGLLVGVGLLRGVPPMQLLQAALSVAAATVPEGLPTYLTLALAAGARRLARRGVFVRDLPTAESVGMVNVICADKTGTLTRAEMTVRTIVAGKAWWSVTGNGFEPSGRFLREGDPADPLADPDLRVFLEVAVRCNNASLSEDPGGGLEVRGSQTEGALLVAALKAGLPREIGREPRLLERAFDPSRRSMTLRLSLDGRPLTCSKGAPEAILPHTARILEAGIVRPMEDGDRAEIRAAVQTLAKKGYRVLALAYAHGDEEAHGLIFAGLAGIVDPPRRELRPVIRRLDRVRIRTVMLTGDHPDTAAAVAHELGLLDGGRELVTGDELKRLDDRHLARIVRRVGVFARVTPEQKARVIRAMQRGGGHVAYVGDGVDDAPAVRAADTGVVPRDRAAAVTREAASIILTDDRLESLVTAIEQAKGTAANTNEITRYLVAANTAEILLLLASAVAGLPLALLPLQVIWLNLIADAPASIALGERHVQPAPGLDARERTADLNEREILVHGLEMGAAAFGLFITTLTSGGTLPVARTMAFGALTAGQLFYLFRCETPLGTPCGLRLPSEAGITLAAATTGLLLLGSVYFPPLAATLGTHPLTMGQWMAVLGTGLAGNLSAVAGFSLRPEPALPAPIRA